MSRIFWLLFLAACVALSANYARGEVTVLAGATRFGAPSDGTYHNVNQPSDFSGLTQPSVGVRWDSARLPFNTSVGVQYTYFGKAKTDALAVHLDAPMAGGYIPNSGGQCVGPCAPLARWIMESEAQAVTLVAVKHLWKFSLEWGLDIYETKTRGKVEFYDGNTDFHYKPQRHLATAQMYGIGYADGPWSARLQLRFMNGPFKADDLREAPAIFNDEKTWTLLLGYSF